MTKDFKRKNLIAFTTLPKQAKRLTTSKPSSLKPIYGIVCRSLSIHIGISSVSRAEPRSRNHPDSR